MYVKFTSDGGSGTYVETYGATAMKQAIDYGTIYTSTPISQGLSAASGTGPSSGMYSTANLSSSTDTGYFDITKYHYAKGQATGYTPSLKARFYQESTYGMRFTLYSSNGSNGLPYSNDSHMWTNQTSTSTITGRMIGAHWNNVSEVHMIINDTTFAVQIISTGSDASKEYGTFIWNDIEYNQAIDTAAFAGNSLYCPSIGIWHVVEGYPEVDGTAATNNRGCIGRSQYLGKDGVYRNTSIQDADYGWGKQNTVNSTYCTTEPRPRSRIWEMPITGGDKAHQLIPVNYVGHMDDNNEYGDPRRGRLMNLYRTSEGQFQTGDVIVDGSTRYRVFANCVKAGSTGYSAATHGQAYAFPEDNVPFA
jgi:hypothetical protein